MLNKLCNHIIRKFTKKCIAYYQITDNGINLQYRANNQILSITEHKTLAELKKQYKNFKLKKLI